MTDATAPGPDDEVVTVLDVVDTLEELVGGGRRVPFTPSVVVNEEEILELVDRIRLSLPEDLRAARHVVEEREQLLDRARRDAAELTSRAAEEAERTLREAQARAAALVDEHAITSAATERARAVTEEAATQASTQREEADAYAREVMEGLEQQLDRVLGTVRGGLAALPARPSKGRGRKR